MINYLEPGLLAAVSQDGHKAVPLDAGEGARGARQVLALAVLELDNVTVPEEKEREERGSS